jgi:hypothetical protein
MGALFQEKSFSESCNTAFGSIQLIVHHQILQPAISDCYNLPPYL